jgi:hypothetical protein
MINPTGMEIARKIRKYFGISSSATSLIPVSWWRNLPNLISGPKRKSKERLLKRRERGGKVPEV